MACDMMCPSSNSSRLLISMSRMERSLAPAFISRSKSSTDIVSPSGIDSFLVWFAGALGGAAGPTGGCCLWFLTVLSDAAEFVLVNMARGALEGSAAVSLEIVPLGGL